MYCQHDSETDGFEMFDENNVKVLEAGKVGGSVKREVFLQEGERIVGVRANVRGGLSSVSCPCQDDVHFIIGRMALP